MEFENFRAVGHEEAVEIKPGKIHERGFAPVIHRTGKQLQQTGVHDRHAVRADDFDEHLVAGAVLIAELDVLVAGLKNHREGRRIEAELFVRVPQIAQFLRGDAGAGDRLRERGDQ